MKSILLDRDGVINYDSLEYIKSVDEVRYIPGSLKAIATLTQLGYCIGIATNQSGISRGLYTEDTLNEIHNYLHRSVESIGGKIHAIEYCKHMPDSGCSCRKPKPGMLNSLIQYLGCEPSETPFIGDRITDIQAAYTAGLNPIVIESAMTDMEGLKDYSKVPIYASLEQYVDSVMQRK